MTMRTVAVLCVVLVGRGVTASAQTPTPERPPTTPPASTAPAAPDEDPQLTALREKAMAGDMASQSALGFYFEIRQEFEQAVSWFRKAADQGHPKAQNQLGLAYALGVGVPQDYAEAMSWYRKSAAQNDVKAQNNLGVMYDTGLGVPQDYAEAVSWYRKAADQGDAFAQNNVGVMFDTGRGVPQDYAEAVSWYRKSAYQGDAYAQNNLGVMYAKGQGVPQDYVSAYLWYNLAATNETWAVYKEAEKNRDDVASKMTPQQIADAKKLTLEWQAAFEKRARK
jgi:TPR repeat protein